MLNATPLTDRFWSKVAQEGDCWIWRAATNSRGYGVFSTAGVLQLAHRASYEYMRCEIPEGLTIDHLCRNRRCVNPDHLDPVTTRVNNARSQGTRTASARRAWAAKKAA